MTDTIPGSAPQLPQAERIQNQTVNAANSWDAAMALVAPQAGLSGLQPSPAAYPTKEKS